MNSADTTITILDIFESYSGILIFLALLLLNLSIVSGCKIIAKEIKFIFRRTEILDVNDTLRHVPRDLKSDYFHKDQQ